MQFYFKAQSQHGHSMLQLAVELARIRSFFGDAPYSVAGSEPNTVLVAKSDTLGGACL